MAASVCAFAALTSFASRSIVTGFVALFLCRGVLLRVEDFAPFVPEELEVDFIAIASVFPNTAQIRSQRPSLSQL